MYLYCTDSDTSHHITDHRAKYNRDHLWARKAASLQTPFTIICGINRFAHPPSKTNSRGFFNCYKAIELIGLRVDADPSPDTDNKNNHQTQ